MKVHLVDGTFELFRAYFGAPKVTAADGVEVGAVRGLLRSLLALTREPGVTHIGVAFDHEIESFRNALYPGYKTRDGVPADLLAQFTLAEDASRALGLVTWPLVDFEADDGLATAAARFEPLLDAASQVVICSPDKDLMQCVRGTRVICEDRLRRVKTDAEGVVKKFGVLPESVPDYLALVGDSADGFPGVPRWGAKSASAVLAAYLHLEHIPEDERTWRVQVRGAAALGSTWRAHRSDAELFRTLATLRTDVPLVETLDDLRWRGVNRPALTALGERLGDSELLTRVLRQGNF